MIRIIEPELMSGIDQCDQFFRDHPQENYRGILDWIKQRSNLSGTVADLGCGPGRFDLALCQEFPNILVHAFDASGTMLDIAAKICKESPYRSRIQFFHQNIVDISIRYDQIISINTLHHLHDPALFWQSVKRISRPGAQIFVADLVRPNTVEEVDRITKVLGHNKSPLYVTDLRNSLMAAFTVDDIQQQMKTANLDDYDIDPIGDVCRFMHIHVRLD